MTEREILTELLAIKLYEHDHQSGSWPPKPGASLDAWMKIADEDRQTYRDMIGRAERPQDLYR